MREIKFRAWDGKEMRQVTSMQFEGGGDLKDVNSGLWVCPIMQFTGLHDKNGKEIYEGDVVEIKPTRQADGRGEVVWSDRGAKFAVRKVKKNGYGPRETYLYSLIGSTVIGNIYENPDILN